jgi:hypothetical protein
MKWIHLVAVFVLMTSAARSQELYVFTEPASNMASGSLGARLTSEGFLNSGFANRTIPEVMVGLNRNLMAHGQIFLSDMYGRYKFEGGSLYAKYRLLSLDGIKTHSRLSVFGRWSKSNNPGVSEDINLEGDNSGVQGGLIFTKLLHKLAMSATAGYAKAFDGSGKQEGRSGPDQMIRDSLSSGYLLFPVVYKDYKQPNFNLYLELLGKTNPANRRSYLDLAPALQVVLDSRTRIDLGYRFQVAGDIPGRYTRNMYLARVEFNFFNVLN